MRTTAFVTFAILAWLTSSTGAAQPSTAPVPTLSVGDRWTYKVTDRDGARIATVSEETREVTAVGPDGITVRTGVACVEDTRTFITPLQRYAFPLAPGKRWNQWVEYVDESGGSKGKINYFARVRGWDKLASAGGSVDAIRMDVIVRLDDADAFRNATECNFSFWYAPSVRGSIREQRKAGYLEKGVSPAPMRLVDASYELVGFAPGKP